METTQPKAHFTPDWIRNRQAVEIISNFSEPQREKLLSLFAELVRTQGDLRIELQNLRDEIQKLNQ